MSATQDEILESYRRTPFWRTLGVIDWLWAVAVVAGRLVQGPGRPVPGINEYQGLRLAGYDLVHARRTTQ